jgi:hypothetical protein
MILNKFKPWYRIIKGGKGTTNQLLGCPNYSYHIVKGQRISNNPHNKLYESAYSVSSFLLDKPKKISTIELKEKCIKFLVKRGFAHWINENNLVKKAKLAVNGESLCPFCEKSTEWKGVVECYNCKNLYSTMLVKDDTCD